MVVELNRSNLNEEFEEALLTHLAHLAIYSIYPTAPPPTHPEVRHGREARWVVLANRLLVQRHRLQICVDCGLVPVRGGGGAGSRTFVWSRMAEGRRQWRRAWQLWQVWRVWRVRQRSRTYSPSCLEHSAMLLITEAVAG